MDGANTGIRHDIQVLRGYAVIVVLVYHMGLAFPDGGYLGVDVFFVISGYLIAQIIARDRAAGTFSLGDFYFRRIKRLVPAALVTLLLTAIASYWMLTSIEMRAFTAQLTGAVTFTANWVLAGQTGYFNDSAMTKPLLHLWSLAIEGQFYLVLPLMMLVLGRRLWLPALALTVIASLTWYLVLNQSNPDAAFYWTGTRTWELALGGTAAMLPPGARLERSIKLLFWPAFAAILAFTMAPDLGLVPGGEVFGACVATAIVVLRQHPMFGAPAFRHLSRAGDASYSLYLTHWPLMAFLFNAYSGFVPPSYRLLTLALGIVAGMMLYRFVETPFRGKWLRPSLTPVAGYVVASALVIGVQAGVYLMSANPGFDYATARKPNTGLGNLICEQDGAFQPFPECRSSEDPTMMVWGDSFAMAVVPGIVATSKNGLVQATNAKCPPMANSVFYTANTDRGWSFAVDCLTFNRAVMAYLSATPSIRLVVLSSPFDQGFRSVLVDDGTGLRDGAAGRDMPAEAMRATIKAIEAMGRKAIIIAPPPRADGDTGRCLERRATGKLVLNARADCTYSRKTYERNFAPTLRFLHDVAESGIDMIWPIDTLCDSESCRVADGQTPLYRDSRHLSTAGSVFVAGALGIGPRLDALVDAATAP
ncbi:MAG: acyltransferase family protein [Devosia sp.]